MIKEFFNNNGKLAGTLKDGIYRKKVDSVKHKMRMFNAYGIDKKIMLQLKELGCEEIRIKEVDTERVLSARMDDFLNNGIERSFDGDQVFLPVKFFTNINDKQAKLL